jgi:hypothetical protein
MAWLSVSMTEISVFPSAVRCTASRCPLRESDAYDGPADSGTPIRDSSCPPRSLQTNCLESM